MTRFAELGGRFAPASRWRATAAGLIALGGLTIVQLAAPGAARAVEPGLTADAAHSIAVDAYLYLYPLVTMDVTREQLTNMPVASGLGGPPDVFVNVPTFPTADMRSVVRPNFDTLYSSAWLDLSKEPAVVSVPDTGGRYYLLPMLDMWTDVFASPGWRTTGTGAGNFLVTPPGWQGADKEGWQAALGLPADTQHIAAPTPNVWIIGRTKTDGPPDYDAVHKIQAGYKITPLSGWGKNEPPPAYNPDPSVDVKTSPKVTVDNMKADRFFAYAAKLMGSNPPHVTDQPIVARMSQIGLEPGKPFDVQSLPADIRAAVEKAPADAQALMRWKTPTLARVANGWSLNTDTMGVYGNYYLKRAILAQIGLGANLPEDAIYPLNLTDSTGQPLDGAHSYTVHFDKENLPPVDAFWSITLYDEEGFQVGNPLDRFALSSWMPFVINPDGSLDLMVGTKSPGGAMEANWLPAPKGPFTLTMRLYAPKSEALTGRWVPPPVTRNTMAPFIGTQ